MQDLDPAPKAKKDFWTSGVASIHLSGLNESGFGKIVELKWSSYAEHPTSVPARKWTPLKSQPPAGTT